jgi:hypothetical protein
VEDVRLHAEPAQVAGDGDGDVRLAAGGQADGDDDDAGRVEEVARLSDVDLGRGQLLGLGQIVDGVDQDAGAAPDAGRVGVRLGGAFDVSPKLSVSREIVQQGVHGCAMPLARIRR